MYVRLQQFSALDLPIAWHIPQSKSQSLLNSKSACIILSFFTSLTSWPTRKSPSFLHCTAPVAMLLPLNVKCIYLLKDLAIFLTWNILPGLSHSMLPYLLSICFLVKSSLTTQFKIESTSQCSLTHFLLFVSPKHYQHIRF